MRKYETTFIISGAVSDADRETIIARYEMHLENNGATFERTVRWGKRQLAYEIKKQTRGYYVIFYYQADPSIIRAFHHELDLNEQILRYMTLKSDGAHPEYIRDEGEPTELASQAAEIVKAEEEAAALEEVEQTEAEASEAEETDAETETSDDAASGEAEEAEVDTDDAETAKEEE